MRLSRFIAAAFAATTLFPVVSSAQQVQFLGAKFDQNNGGMQLGNQFDPGPHPWVGPYSMKFTQGGSAFDIYCIDFDNAFSGNVFTARVLTFADVVNSSLSFNGVDNLTALKRALGTQSTFPGGTIPNSNYLPALQITGALAHGFGAAPASHWDERHYAIWGLFSDNVTAYENDGVNNPNVIGSAAESQVFGGYTASEWRIIIDERAWDRSYTGNLEQTSIAELSVVPEPGTYALVGVGMLVLAGVSRRRNRSPQVTDGKTQQV